MSGTPDSLNVVLGSATWSDAITTSEYLAQIRDNDDAIVERVRSLRDETRAAVGRLEDAQERIEAARDAIAAREAELAGSRAAVQASYAELSALKAEREATLDALIARQEDLESDVSSIAGQIREQEEALADPATSSPEEPLPPPVPGATATLLPDGRAVPPAGAPPAVVAAIEAANAISDTPYLWGGGHGSFESSGYDCSGAVSYALHAGGFLSSPLDSTGLAFWGEEGAGSWITVYAYSGHAYAVIAGLRWDTSGGAGPRWHADMRSSAGFVARHPSGY
jgi:cell wall-associated NlpC family hydrolase